ncbi:RHS repeat-associated core domain-containing protein, partial [Rheinheimera texasensis]|uniref:RHS repeat domain-containing protein n=1 Tax=Rheinheimera texasensis TaxID=306205 RepID=UPI0032B221C5
MVSDFEVIHMGGRTYNPVLGRFMQADPFIQQPSNLQSFNRYSYVLNNPMSYTDPSGYLFKALNKLLGDLAPLVSIAIAVYLPGMNFLQGLHAAQIGAITGFVSGGVATGSLRGALTGALSGAAFGSLHNWKSNLVAKGIDYGRIAAHGIVGGISSELSGGKFGHGFAAAGFTQAASQIGGEGLFIEGAESISDRASNAIKAAIIGGSASVLSGGKFVNGAITGAFSRLLNDDAVSSAKAAFMKKHAINEREYSAVVKLIKNINGLSNALKSRMEFEDMLDSLNSEQLQMLGKLTGVSVSNFTSHPEFARKAISDAYRYNQMNGLLRMTAGAGKSATEVLYSDPSKNIIINSSPSWVRQIFSRYDNFNDFKSAVEDTL